MKILRHLEKFFPRQLYGSCGIIGAQRPNTPPTSFTTHITAICPKILSPIPIHALPCTNRTPLYAFLIQHIFVHPHTATKLSTNDNKITNMYYSDMKVISHNPPHSLTLLHLDTPILYSYTLYYIIKYSIPFNLVLNTRCGHIDY